MLVGGPFLMIAILLYWVANNIWTYGQQHLVFRRSTRKKKRRSRQRSRRDDNAPKPGARPDPG